MSVTCRRRRSPISLFSLFLELIENALNYVIERIVRLLSVVKTAPRIAFYSDIHIVAHARMSPLYAYIISPIDKRVQQVQRTIYRNESYLCNACMHTYDGN